MTSSVTSSSERESLRELPRQLASTGRFSLGIPSQFTIADDGSRLLFVRSRGGEDGASCLWLLDKSGERLLAGPEHCDGEGLAPEAEMARRERVGEQSTGIVTYSSDHSAATAVFAQGEALWTASADGTVRRVPCQGSPVDAQIDPTGVRVAYVSGGALRVVELVDGTDSLLAAPESHEVTYGLPEHVAAEEMHRFRGHWWSPNGTHLLVARVDNRAVQRWWISDPSDPSAPPREIFYPLAGTANADVSLFVLGLDGTRTEVLWDRRAFEYVATADWDRHGPLIGVQSRDQRTLRTLAVDPATGKTAVLYEDTDELWVSLVPGTPVRTESGRLVVVSDVRNARRLVYDGELVTDDGFQVREVLGIRAEQVWFVASTEPTEEHVWTYTPGEGVRAVTKEPGLHRATVEGDTVVMKSFTERGHQVIVTGPVLEETPVASLEAVPVVEPAVRWLSLGPREIRTALLLPRAYERGGPPLPVLMCPYAGPALQRVTRARHWHFVEAQWFAEQGFAVVIADGAGTPGRGPKWEREIHGDVLSPVIDDQVAALYGAAEHCPDLDLSRVAMRGWSYGGLLSLACVLRRPDVFHAAVAGAAPVDMHLYDTHYRERYLGHPDAYPENYVRCSVVHEAAALRHPLLIIHGLGDDNVTVANALRMSAALLAARKHHEILLLPGATHITIDPEVDADLYLYELQFLRRSLAPSEERMH